MPPLAGTDAPATASSEEVVPDPRLAAMLLDNGYTEICAVGRQVCAVLDFNFTSALVVGLDHETYARRYCYERRADAIAALVAWDGAGHPSGPWIKCKGPGIELLNPALV